jgi:copper homeostasis protein CutC
MLQCVVMAGGGVTADNAKELVRITGVSEVHATARVSMPSRMVYKHMPTVYMGGEKVSCRVIIDLCQLP